MKLTSLTKKLLSTASVAAIAATSVLNTVVFGANLDNATASVTLSNSVATETLTVTVSGKDFSSDTVNRVVIKNNAGTQVYTTGSVDTNANGSFAISTVDFDAAGLNQSTRYTVSFETVAGDLGAAVLVVNNDNRIVVSAKVDPVLKFAIQSTGFNLGVLSSNYTEVTGGLELGTNATAGVTVTAASQRGGLYSANASHTIALSGNDTLFDNESYQFYTITGANDGAANLVSGILAPTEVDETNESNTVYTANRPQNFDTAGDYDVDFVVRAKISESTPAAADYTDTITFTVTGNF